MQSLFTSESQVNRNSIPSFSDTPLGHWQETSCIEEMAEKLRPVYPGGVPILDKESFRERKVNIPVTVKKCSCRSIWCYECYKRYYLPELAEKLSRFDWRKTRQIVLTMDREQFETGFLAMEMFYEKRLIGRFMRDLQRGRKNIDPVKVTQWLWVLEWHKDGFPHWHLFIEVEKEGKAGMIGGETIRRFWKNSVWIHESYFRDEQHFNELTGYFGKTGYFEKDKAYQAKLPEEIKNAKYRKIMRFHYINVEDRKRRKLGHEEEKKEKLTQAEENKNFYEAMEFFNEIIMDGNDRAREILGECKGKKTRKKSESYQVILERCGSETMIDFEMGTSTSRCILEIDYNQAKEITCGKYQEGVGMLGEATLDVLSFLVKKIRKVLSVTWHMGEKDVYEKKNIFMKAAA